MASPLTHAVTIGDVLKGLESMEKWIGQMREALATIEERRQPDARPTLVVTAGGKKEAPRISGGVCPPAIPGKKDKDKKKPTKK